MVMESILGLATAVNAPIIIDIDDAKVLDEHTLEPLQGDALIEAKEKWSLKLEDLV